MTAATATLTEFLLARIAEDEAGAQAATVVDWLWPPMLDDRDVGPSGTESNAAYFATVDFVRRHDPARVLAECEAKRRIVGRHLSDGDDFPLCSTCREVGPDAQAWPCDTLRDLATIYADHPDYRDEWRP